MLGSSIRIFGQLATTPFGLACLSDVKHNHLQPTQKHAVGLGGLNEERTMAQNLVIDDSLVEEARQSGHHATQAEAVTRALEEYIRRCKRQGIVELFGTVDYDDSYDYKAERTRTRP